MKTLEQVFNDMGARYLAELTYIEKEIAAIDEALSATGEREVYDIILAGTYHGDEYIVEDDYNRGYLC